MGRIAISAGQTTATQEATQQAELAALYFPSMYYFQDQNWAAKAVSVAADRYKLLSPNVVNMDVAGTPLRITAQQTLDLSLEATWDTIAGTDYRTAGNRAGKDFYIYACDSSGTLVLKVSANASAPSGYTTADSRLLGGFHCLCVAVDNNSSLTAWAADTVIALGETRKSTVWNGKIIRCTARAGDFKTHATDEPNVAAAAVGATIVDDQITWVVEQHWLEGYLAGDILPASVWDAKRRSTCTPGAKVYSPLVNKWCDIYLQSGTLASTASVYGGTVTHSRTYPMHALDQKMVGCSLPTFNDFVAFALGSNWYAVAGGADPATTGGLSDAFGRRMISDLGCEDMCGSHYHYIVDMAGLTSVAVAGGEYDGAGAVGPFATYSETILTDASIARSTRGVAPSLVTL